ncbi:MAG: hypothetical protein HY290_32515 [Planctomycetia bacterium]|nr:hypothetical protein [Planctomycetia bacterium]
MASTAFDPAPDEPGEPTAPFPMARFLQILGWDGALPLVVALAPAFVKTFWPQPPVGVGLFLILAPPGAAMFRAHIGWHQIAQRCGGRAPWLRQVAMAAAIAMLFLFESAVSALTFANNAPAGAWWIPCGSYAAYLAFVTFALRPDSSKPPPRDDRSGM